MGFFSNNKTEEAKNISPTKEKASGYTSGVSSDKKSSLKYPNSVTTPKNVQITEDKSNKQEGPYTEEKDVKVSSIIQQSNAKKNTEIPKIDSSRKDQENPLSNAKVEGKKTESDNKSKTKKENADAEKLSSIDSMGHNSTSVVDQSSKKTGVNANPIRNKEAMAEEDRKKFEISTKDKDKNKNLLEVKKDDQSVKTRTKEEEKLSGSSKDKAIDVSGSIKKETTKENQAIDKKNSNDAEEVKKDDESFKANKPRTKEQERQFGFSKNKLIDISVSTKKETTKEFIDKKKSTETPIDVKGSSANDKKRLSTKVVKEEKAIGTKNRSPSKAPVDKNVKNIKITPESKPSPKTGAKTDLPIKKSKSNSVQSSQTKSKTELHTQKAKSNSVSPSLTKSKTELHTQKAKSNSVSSNFIKPKTKSTPKDKVAKSRTSSATTSKEPKSSGKAPINIERKRSKCNEKLTIATQVQNEPIISAERVRVRSEPQNQKNQDSKVVKTKNSNDSANKSLNSSVKQQSEEKKLQPQIISKTSKIPIFSHRTPITTQKIDKTINSLRALQPRIRQEITPLVRSTKSTSKDGPVVVAGSESDQNIPASEKIVTIRSENIELKKRTHELLLQNAILNKRVIKEQERSKNLPKSTSSVPTSLEVKIHFMVGQYSSQIPIPVKN
jgi:hypothetical protein